MLSSIKIRKFARIACKHRVCFSTIPRSDWTYEEIETIYNTPLLELISKARNIHEQNFQANQVQKCTLLSIKTGGCVEDCKYCSQSSKYKTDVKPTPMMKVEEVLIMAKNAKDSGSTRFCMGAAWRDVGESKDRKSFDRVLHMVKGVSDMGK